MRSPRRYGHELQALKGGLIESENRKSGRRRNGAPPSRELGSLHPLASSQAMVMRRDESAGDTSEGEREDGDRRERAKMRKMNDIAPATAGAGQVAKIQTKTLRGRQTSNVTMVGLGCTHSLEVSDGLHAGCHLGGVGGGDVGDVQGAARVPLVRVA